MEILSLPDWVLPSLVGGSLTFVVTLLGVVVLNRRSLLTYHVTHNRIGISTLDNIHGEVSVTVGGNRMHHMNMYCTMLRCLLPMSGKPCMERLCLSNV